MKIEILYNQSIARNMDYIKLLLLLLLYFKVLASLETLNKRPVGYVAGMLTAVSSHSANLRTFITFTFVPWKQALFNGIHVGTAERSSTLAWRRSVYLYSETIRCPALFRVNVGRRGECNKPEVTWLCCRTRSAPVTETAPFPCQHIWYLPYRVLQNGVLVRVLGTSISVQDMHVLWDNMTVNLK